MEMLVVSKALAIIHLRLEVTRVGLVVEDEVEKWMVGGQGGGFEGMRALAMAWCWQGLSSARVGDPSQKMESVSALTSSQDFISGGVQLNRLDRFTQLGFT